MELNKKKKLYNNLILALLTAIIMQKTYKYGREEAAASYINLQDASTYQLIRLKLLGGELNLDPCGFPVFPSSFYTVLEVPMSQMQGDGNEK